MFIHKCPGFHQIISSLARYSESSLFLLTFNSLSSLFETTQVIYLSVPEIDMSALQEDLGAHSAGEGQPSIGKQF